MYRPQYFFKTPDGFTDEPFSRPVSLLDPPITVLNGQPWIGYPVRMDKDAPQIIRSLFFQGLQQGQGPGTFDGSIQIRIRDAGGRDLTDGFVPLWNYAWGAGINPPDGGSGKAKPFEPEMYCEPGSVVTFDFFNPGTAAGSIVPTFAAAPALMSPAHTAVQMEEHAVGGQAQAAGVINYNGALYQVLQYVGLPFPAGGGSINVFKSTDGGAHWTRLDFADSPVLNALGPEPQAGVYYDGNGTLTVAFTTGSVLEASAQPIVLQQFSLASGTWGTPFGAGSGNVYQINQCFIRPDGSVLVIAVDALSGGAVSSLSAFVFAGGVWSSFVLQSSFPGGWTTNGMSSCVLDPATGIIHMFGIAFSAGPTKHQYYQQLTAANLVAHFQDTTALYGAASAMGNPIIVGNNLLWGVTDVAITFGTIAVGTPLSNPVFTVAPAPGVNPLQPIPYGINPNTLQPTLGFDGANIWAVVVDNRNGAGPGRVWLSVTSNLGNPAVGWTGAVIYDDATAVFQLGGTFQYPTIAFASGAIYITFQNATGQPTNYFISAIATGSIGPGLFELRGVKRYQGCTGQ